MKRQKATFIICLIISFLSSFSQEDKRPTYNLTPGINYSLYDIGIDNFRPLIKPTIGVNLTRFYSEKFGINAGIRYSQRGSKNDTLSIHNHYSDFFLAPRYAITPKVSVESGLQFNNFLYQITKYPNNTLKGTGSAESQLEIFTGLAIKFSENVNMNVRYTIPFKWMDHSNIALGISYKILPRKKKAEGLFWSLEDALENPLACRKLVLQRQGIEELPENIRLLVNLEHLFLDGNNVRTLPTGIGELAHLQFLFLRNNQLQQLPPEIGFLKQLEELDLRYNQLTSLPDEIGNLESLKFLYLQNNFINEIPPAIGNLQSLIELDVSNNTALMTLPAEINQLRNLEKLIISSHTLLPLPFSPGSKLKVIIR